MIDLFLGRSCCFQPFTERPVCYRSARTSFDCNINEGLRLKTPYSLYGIKNCDTIKKARRWLEDHQVDYRFHDYRADGLDDVLLQRLIDGLGWETLLNTRGTTWRKLSDEQKTLTNNQAAAKALMLEQPSIIKRPVLTHNDSDSMLLGFSADSYQQIIDGAK